jgi:hypothetical protein
VFPIELGGARKEVAPVARDDRSHGRRRATSDRHRRHSGEGVGHVRGVDSREVHGGMTRRHRGQHGDAGGRSGRKGEGATDAERASSRRVAIVLEAEPSSTRVVEGKRASTGEAATMARRGDRRGTVMELASEPHSSNTTAAEAPARG